ncbi:HCL155Cp [Eremothecium sinecaudum]|uniref:HCL155Cp n=1 Tax=Eremothecium sinecaudum TaxID=45286 RepID=A0A109UWL8_9SACH|nr:HCL155Cp [Eremothecium sinecaudum]AMD19996.1 HCL155Cp [Eremothecium sinecaudum]
MSYIDGEPATTYSIEQVLPEVRESTAINNEARKLQCQNDAPTNIQDYSPKKRTNITEPNGTPTSSNTPLPKPQGNHNIVPKSPFLPGSCRTPALIVCQHEEESRIEPSSVMQLQSPLVESSSPPGQMDIVQFPTDKLLEMLTGLLYKIITSNDRLMPFEQDKHDVKNKYVAHVLSFRGKHIPAITLGDYFARIQKYCPITNDVFLSLLVYFDRIAKRCNALDPQLFVMDSYNIHRLIIAAVTVSTKFFSDFFYSNSRYARVGGISLQELNRLELQFSILCDFELIVSVQELQRYADLLYKFWRREHQQDLPINVKCPNP